MNQRLVILVGCLVILAGCTDPERPSTFLDTRTIESLPHIQSVDVTPARDIPKRQIIHVLDWHYVDGEDFAGDIQESTGRSLTGRQIEAEWQAFLNSVDAVQTQQGALLRKLYASHRVSEVFLERLTLEGQHDAKGVVDFANRVPDTDKDGQDFNRELRMRLGAAWWVKGLTVRPAESESALKAANAVRVGKSEFDAAAGERREDEIVKNILVGRDPVVVLICDGSHDFSDNVPGGVEIVRVQVAAHAAAVGD